jgi:hypothetical protein
MIMPPLSEKMQIVDRDGLPVDVDTSKGYFVREGLIIPEVLFLPAELHYAAATIHKMGVFDLALTYEQPYKRRGLSRGWIASKRFYEYCMAQSFKVDWQPVRIDD